MNELEKNLANGVLPWTNIEFRTKTYWAFSEKNATMVFVPVEKTIEHLTECYMAAYKFGCNQYLTNKSSNFKIVQHVGDDAIIQYPHIILILTREPYV